MHKLITWLGVAGVVCAIAAVGVLAFALFPDLSQADEFKILIGAVAFLLWLVLQRLDEIVRLLRRS